MKVHLNVIHQIILTLVVGLTVCVFHPHRVRYSCLEEYTVILDNLRNVSTQYVFAE